MTQGLLWMDGTPFPDKETSPDLETHLNIVRPGCWGCTRSHVLCLGLVVLCTLFHACT